MAYRPENVVLFIAEHRQLVGDSAPHMIAKAFDEAARCGMSRMFPAACTEVIFNGDINLRHAFAGAFEGDIRHMMLGLGQQPLDIVTLLVALFGDKIPEEILKELEPLMQEGEQAPTDITPLLRQMGNVLRSRGVAWEDRWFIREPAAPVESMPADKPQE